MRLERFTLQTNTFEQKPLSQWERGWGEGECDIECYRIVLFSITVPSLTEGVIANFDNGSATAYYNH